MNVIEKNITLADGRVITLETGKLAKQADGAVMLKMGNTCCSRLWFLLRVQVLM